MCRKSENSDFSELERQMMEEALALAKVAITRNEVPVGAVLYTPQGDMVAGAYNQMITANDASAHAEVLALRRAGALRRNYRLCDLHIAVTLEPCAMCIGAIFHARVKQLIYGAQDPKGGACGKVVNLPSYKALNHHLTVRGGLYAAQAATLLREFFGKRR